MKSTSAAYRLGPSRTLAIVVAFVVVASIAVLGAVALDVPPAGLPAVALAVGVIVRAATTSYSQVSGRRSA